MALCGLDQSVVEDWLKANEVFTNNFILDWVVDHPELHLALFKSNPVFASQIPSLPYEILNTADSGVDIEQELSHKSSFYDNVQEIGSEATVLTVVSDSSSLLGVTDEVDREVASITQETVRSERLEAMLDLAVSLSGQLSKPQVILNKVLHRAQLLFGCTIVNLFIRDLYESEESPLGTESVVFSRAFRIGTVDIGYDYSGPISTLDVEDIPELVAMAQEMIEKDCLYQLDENDNTLCISLRGEENNIVGVIVLIYNESEMDVLDQTNLQYLQQFSVLCGLALDQSRSVANLTKHSKKLLQLSSNMYSTKPQHINFIKTKWPSTSSDDTFRSATSNSGDESEVQLSGSDTTSNLYDGNLLIDSTYGYYNNSEHQSITGHSQEDDAMTLNAIKSTAVVSEHSTKRKSKNKYALSKTKRAISTPIKIFRRLFNTV